MALGCETILGADRVSGLVITADGCEAPLQSVRCLVAGHPLPDERGLAAARALAKGLERCRGPILFLLSGGASSLLVQPRPPVSLADKIATSARLLACGADIAAFNCVRKHLSLHKGGGLLRCAAGPFHTLILSDVVGDDPSVIGSGPTVPDPTTYLDAWRVLERHGLTSKVPPTVRTLLTQGCEGRVEETVKPADAIAARSAVAAVVGSNRIALEAAAGEASARGWTVRVIEEPLEGDTVAAAITFAMEIDREVKDARTTGRRTCLIAGGETTVTVRGRGRGGRNQEFALALVERLADRPVTVLSAGSDGIDGPTAAAGAFVDGQSLGRARQIDLDPEPFLADNDSSGFFARMDDLFRPGPTGTNVADLKFALIG